MLKNARSIRFHTLSQPYHLIKHHILTTKTHEALNTWMEKDFFKPPGVFTLNPTQKNESCGSPYWNMEEVKKENGLHYFL